MELKIGARHGVAADGSRQVVEILVADGYHPSRIEAFAGVPLRLVFHRTNDDACLDRVVFSAPRIERYLAPRSTTIVDIPPSHGREIRFTCGMGRYRGRIVLVTPPAHVVAARRRALRRLIVLGAVSAALAVSLLVLSARGPIAIEPLASAAFVAFALLAVIVFRRGRGLRPPAESQATAMHGSRARRSDTRSASSEVVRS